MNALEIILTCISVMLVWSGIFGNYAGWQSGCLGDMSLPLRLLKICIAILIWLIYFTSMYFYK